MVEDEDTGMIDGEDEEADEACTKIEPAIDDCAAAAADDDDVPPPAELIRNAEVGLPLADTGAVGDDWTVALLVTMLFGAIDCMTSMVVWVCEDGAEEVCIS